MCCATYTALNPMATTQFMRTACVDVCWPAIDQQKRALRPLRMNWVVVTDNNGHRQLKMNWYADRDD